MNKYKSIDLINVEKGLGGKGIFPSLYNRNKRNVNAVLVVYLNPRRRSALGRHPIRANVTRAGQWLMTNIRAFSSYHPFGGRRQRHPFPVGIPLDFITRNYFPVRPFQPFCTAFAPSVHGLTDLLLAMAVRFDAFELLAKKTTLFWYRPSLQIRLS